ncbi:MAG: hypothetical protein RG741_07450 [Bacteroidales bacterium]|nr:hypothetical protein [Bacteroidales bacterium]
MNSRLEEVLVTEYKTGMIAFLQAHPECFREALDLAVSDRQPWAWRAAWLLWSCMEENDTRLRDHVHSIISSFHGKGDGHLRELIKILYLMELDEEAEGLLFDHCVGIWEAVGKRPSVRYNALRMIVKIVKRHPDLQREIGFLTRDHYLETLSPGIKRAVPELIKGSLPA